MRAVAVRVAITGTPGTGKSSSCAELIRLGYVVVDLAQFAAEKGLLRKGRKAGTPAIVDVERLRKVPFPEGDLVFVCSHLSHLLDADKVIVLRCSPKVLEKRLRARGWPDAKIRENVEAEAIDLFTVEAMQRCKKVYEVDSTKLDSAEAARQIIEIVKGSVKGHKPGRIDWSEEILSWY